MLKAENISIMRNDLILHQKLCFTLKERTITLIKGKNGSGKTSLLHAIAGLIPLHSGKITYNNCDITQDEEQNLQKNLNYSGHKHAIKNYLTVRENIEFWARLNRTPSLVKTALTYFNLTSYASHITAKLSAGTQKRVALCRLITCPKKIWLLDEPFTHLDNEHKKKLSDLICAHIRRDGLVLIATHETIPNNNIHLQPNHSIKLEGFR